MHRKVIAISTHGKRHTLTVKRTGDNFLPQHLKGVQFFDSEGFLADNLEHNQIRLKGERLTLPSDWPTSIVS